ncbi:hypothetical protein BMS3Abin06_01242 [bacterium BMS3Abin06]|nr:hypothetical protein BMS3Abin06_01242 [bacterium BMS3Abin06]
MLGLQNYDITQWLSFPIFLNKLADFFRHFGAKVFISALQAYVSRTVAHQPRIEYSEALYHVIWSSHLDYIGKSTPEKALNRLNAQNQA